MISIAHNPEVVRLHRRQLAIDPVSHRLSGGALAAG